MSEDNIKQQETDNLEDNQEVVQEQPQDEGVLADSPTVKEGKKAKKEKKKLTPEQKKKRTIKGLIIAGACLLALAIFFGSCAIANAVGSNALIEQAKQFESVVIDNQLTTQNGGIVKEDNGWTFVTDRDLKILQFTDVHIGGGCFSQGKDAWALNAVATMIRQEKPDLVVVTGDIAYPVPFQAGTFNNLNATKIFANMMESLQVYWTFAFGNHDTEVYSMYTRVDICDYYENAGFKYCLFDRGFCDEKDYIGEDARGFGNHVIRVKNSKGVYTQALVMLDSHSYLGNDALGIAWKYDNLHECQIEWYKQQLDAMRAHNVAQGAQDVPVKNLAFFHIPLEEYRIAWSQCIGYQEKSGNKFVGKGSVVSKVSAQQAPLVISDDVTLIYGSMGESDSEKNGTRTYGVFCGQNPEQFFETGLQNGLQGVFCGHDHYNNFSVEYKGVRLTYGMSVDYLAYPGIFKEHAQRGCTVITVKADGSFDCTPANYYVDYGVEHER